VMGFTMAPGIGGLDWDAGGGDGCEDPYPSGEGRLAVLNLSPDSKGVCTSAVKGRGGWGGGDHHWG
jgi:hypothetical protein